MNTGGPAYPIPTITYPNGEVQYGSNGMTLLDWFAGQALTGLIAGSKTMETPERFALGAYEVAAAMLAEKQRREGGAA